MPSYHFSKMIMVFILSYAVVSCSRWVEFETDEYQQVHNRELNKKYSEGFGLFITGSTPFDLNGIKIKRAS